MATPETSTVVSSDARRFTIVNLKQVNELPLRNVLQTFDKNGDGKIDITELQKIVYWYGLWKYASFGLCLVIMTLVWSTFGLTIWAIDLTKDYSVTDGVLTGGDEVVKMSVASTHIPLSWATLLDRRHLDALESLTIDVTQGSGKFSAGVYHMKVASYLHANSTYLKLFGADGSRVWVNSGTVVLHHSDAEEAVMVCGAAACNTLAVDVKPEYLQQLVQRSAALYVSSQGFELPAEIDGVAINKAAGEGTTCQASVTITLFSRHEQNYLKEYQLQIGIQADNEFQLKVNEKSLGMENMHKRSMLWYGDLEDVPLALGRETNMRADEQNYYRSVSPNGAYIPINQAESDKAHRASHVFQTPYKADFGMSNYGITAHQIEKAILAQGGGFTPEDAANWEKYF